MKLNKRMISKVKSNTEVDLEFVQETRQECKSFESFDYDDNVDAYFNTIGEKLKYAIECLDDYNVLLTSYKMPSFIESRHNYPETFIETWRKSSRYIIL